MHERSSYALDNCSFFLLHNRTPFHNIFKTISLLYKFYYHVFCVASYLCNISIYNYCFSFFIDVCYIIFKQKDSFHNETSLSIPFDHIYYFVNILNRLLRGDSCLCGSGSHHSNENLAIL